MFTPPSFHPVTRILATLGDELEAGVHIRFRGASGSGVRWARRDWYAMLDAIVALEDAADLGIARSAA
jgi:hypothetical protein